jgi:RHS repeat-associated protein
MFNQRCFFVVLLVAFCVMVGGRNVHAQMDPIFEQGFKPFGSFQGGNIDSVNLLNGYVNLHIPLVSYPQRGGKLHLDLFLNYAPQVFLTEKDECSGGGNNCYYFDLTYKGVEVGNDNQFFLARNCAAPANANQVTGPDGSMHLIGGSSNLSSDGSAFYQAVINSSTPLGCAGGTYTDSLTNRDGVKKTFGWNGSYFSYYEDPNGNKITENYTYIFAGWTDTMNRTVGDFHSSSTISDSTGCLGTLPTSQAVLWSLPGLSSGTQTFKLCFASVNVNVTDVCPPPYCEYPPSGNVGRLQSILLPDGTSWVFQYDTADANHPTAYGDLLKVTFPTGGSISYTWQSVGGVCGGAAYSFSRGLATRSLDANDGQGLHTWTYTINPYLTTRNMTVQDPDGNQTVHIFSPWDAVYGVDNCTTFYETTTQQFQGTSTSGTLLQTTTTNYVSAVPTGSIPYDSPGALASRITTALANGKQKKVEMDYEYPVLDHSLWPLSEGNVVSQREYDFGSGAPGSLLRTTTTTYLAASNANYRNNNLWSLASSVKVLNGAGTQQAYTTLSYDEGSRVSSGITTQHDLNPPNGNYRGNQTSVHRWLNGSTTSTTKCPISVSNGYLVSYNIFFDTGMVQKGTDSCGTSAGDTNHTTTFAYSATYAGAFPTTITNALSQSVTNAYDFNTGLLTSTTDLNSKTTSYAYDNMLRMTQATYPPQTVNGVQLNGLTTFAYPAATQVQISELMDNTSRYRVSNLKVDGVGREIRRNTTNGESTPYDQIDTCYDSMGRVSYKSYPYQSSGLTAPMNCPGTAGDLFAYDPLGRTTSVTHTDGSVILTNYVDSSNHTGRATSVTDEGNGTQGVQKISQVDGLGRLIYLCEVSGNLTVGISGSQTASSCGLDISGIGFLTTYAYDALDNLTSVAQSPLNGRTFVYDSLSHLTQATNPESGSTCYGIVSGGICQKNGYDADGNLVKRTDARTAAITYVYDYLNRLTGKTYSDSTPPVTISYDQTSAMGVSLTNTVGRRSSMSTAGTNLTGSVFSYDSMGRLLNNSQCTPQNCAGTLFPVTYAYDLIGDLTSSTNGLGLTLTYSVNLAGRLTTLANNATAFGSAGTLLGNPNPVHYNAAGSILSASLGNGVNETRTYDGRLRLTGITDGSVYTLTIPTSGGYAPDSNLLVANDSVNGNWTYAYDAFNRLSSANATGQAYTYAYDRFGNRWQQNGPHSSYPGFDANNRMVPGLGVTYDAAGNVTNDGSLGYTYDAESRIVTAGSSASYLYDADGRRVRKVISGVTVDFLYDTAGHEISQVSSTGTWTRGEIYTTGRHLITLNNNTTYYDHADWVGTERARSTSAGTPYETCTSLPFGDWLTCTGSTDPSPMHFAGKERDSESGLDDFGARYFSSQYGRWMSPDRMNVTDERLTNPSNTLNKYIYGANNPFRFVDQDGRDIVALYEPPNVLAGSAGHFMLFANNSTTGESAMMSFGEVDNSLSGRALTATGAPMSATKDFGLPMTADDLREGYAALSVQTTPEQAQEVLNYIKNFSPSSTDYKLFSNNCATVCRDALRALGLIPKNNHNITPKGLWKTIFNRYSKNTLRNDLHKFFGTVPSTTGIDYGNPRFEMNTFDTIIYQLTIRPCSDTWDPKTNTLHSCG